MSPTTRFAHELEPGELFLLDLANSGTITRIVRMVAGRLLARGFHPKGLLRSLRLRRRADPNGRGTPLPREPASKETGRPP